MKKHLFLLLIITLFSMGIIQAQFIPYTGAGVCFNDADCPSGGICSDQGCYISCLNDAACEPFGGICNTFGVCVFFGGGGSSGGDGPLLNQGFFEVDSDCLANDFVNITLGVVGDGFGVFNGAGGSDEYIGDVRFGYSSFDEATCADVDCNFYAANILLSEESSFSFSTFPLSDYIVVDFVQGDHVVTQVNEISSCVTSEPIDGSCGSRHAYYWNSSTSTNGWDSGSLCFTGNPSPTSVSFPSAGNTANWECVGINNGASQSCYAYYGKPYEMSVDFAHEGSAYLGQPFTVDTTFNFLRTHSNLIIGGNLQSLTLATRRSSPSGQWSNKILSAPWHSPLSNLSIPMVNIVLGPEVTHQEVFTPTWLGEFQFQIDARATISDDYAYTLGPLEYYANMTFYYGAPQYLFDVPVEVFCPGQTLEVTDEPRMCREHWSCISESERQRRVIDCRDGSCSDYVATDTCPVDEMCEVRVDKDDVCRELTPPLCEITFVNPPDEHELGEQLSLQINFDVSDIVFTPSILIWTQRRVDGDWTSWSNCSFGSGDSHTCNVTPNQGDMLRVEARCSDGAVLVNSSAVEIDLIEELETPPSEDLDASFSPNSLSCTQGPEHVTVSYDGSVSSIHYCTTTDGDTCEPNINSPYISNGGTITLSGEGIHRICTRALVNVEGRFGSELNLQATQCSGTYRISNTAPSLALSGGYAGWQNTQPTVNIQASDNTCNFNLRYSWNQVLDSTCNIMGTSTGLISSFNQDLSPSQGAQTLYVCVRDQAGNYQHANTTANWETTNPTTSVSLSPSGFGSWQNQPVTITLTCSDTGGSGCSHFLSCVGSGCDLTTITPATSPQGFLFDTSGSHLLRFRSVDNAGNNQTSIGGVSAMVDLIVPNAPSFNPINRTWATSNIQVSITNNTVGPSGVSQTRSCVTTDPSCSPNILGDTVSISGNNEYNVCARIIDGAGNLGEVGCSGPYQKDDSSINPPTINPSNPICQSAASVQVSLTAPSNAAPSGVQYMDINIEAPGGQASGTYVNPISISDQGLTYITARARNNAGTWSPTSTSTIAIDRTPPTSTISVTDRSGQEVSSDQWIDTQATVSISCQNNINEATCGCNFIEYSLDRGETWTTYVSDFDLEQSEEILFRSVDTAGNVESNQTFNLLIDSQDPICGTWSPTDAPWNQGSPQTFTLQNSQFGPSGPIPTQQYECITGPNNGDTCQIILEDNAGNQQTCTSPPNRVDTIGTVSNSWLFCDGLFHDSNDWCHSAIDFVISCSDAGGSGCQETFYCIDSSNTCIPNVADAVGSFSTEGVSYLRFRSVDNAGNVEPTKSTILQIDTTPPETTASATSNGNNYDFGDWTNNSVTVNLSCQDTSSGCDYTRYRVNSGSWQTYTAPFTISQTASLQFYSVDNAGNQEDTESRQINIDTQDPLCGNDWDPSEVSPSNAQGVAQTFTLVNPSDSQSGLLPEQDFTCITGTTHGSTCIVEVYDNAGNMRQCESPANQIGNSPTITLTPAGTGGWVNAPVTITLSAEPGIGRSITSLRYSNSSGDLAPDCTSGGTVIENNGQITLNEGDHTIYACALDNANEYGFTQGTYRIDLTDPVCGTWSPLEASWSTGSPATFTLQNSQFEISGPIPGQVFTCETGSSHGDRCEVTISDRAGNQVICESPPNRIDSQNPVVNASNSDQPWTNQLFNAVVSASNPGPSQITRIAYNWNENLNSACSNGIERTNGASIEVIEGENVLYLCAVDEAGNVGTWNGQYRLDLGDPVVSATNSGSAWQSSQIQATVSWGLSHSPIQRVGYKWDNSSVGSNGCFVSDSDLFHLGDNPLLAPEGDSVLYLCVRDEAGNVNTWNGTYRWADSSSVSVSATNSNYPNWVNSQITATISASTDFGSIEQIRYAYSPGQFNSDCSNGGNLTSNNNNLQIPEGDTTLYLCARASTGQIANWNGRYRWENTLPSISASNSGNDLRGDQIQATISLSDEGGSGINRARYIFVEETEPSSNPLMPGCTGGNNAFDGQQIFSPEGEYTLYLCAVDNANNIASWNGTYRWTSSTPSISFSFEDGFSDFSNWFSYFNRVNVTVSAPIARIERSRYSWNSPLDPQCQNIGTPFDESILIDPLHGENTLYVCAVDEINKNASDNVTVRIDTEPPVCGNWDPLEAPWSQNSNVTFSILDCVDTLSGLASDQIFNCTTGSNHGDTCSLEIADRAANILTLTSPPNRVDASVPSIIIEDISDEIQSLQTTVNISAQPNGPANIVGIRYSYSNNLQNCDVGTLIENNSTLQLDEGDNTLYVCAITESGTVNTASFAYQWYSYCLGSVPENTVLGDNISIYERTSWEYTNQLTAQNNNCLWSCAPGFVFDENNNRCLEPMGDDVRPQATIIGPDTLSILNRQSNVNQNYTRSIYVPQSTLANYLFRFELRDLAGNYPPRIFGEESFSIGIGNIPDAQINIEFPGPGVFNLRALIELASTGDVQNDNMTVTIECEAGYVWNENLNMCTECIGGPCCNEDTGEFRPTNFICQENDMACDDPVSCSAQADVTYCPGSSSTCTGDREWIPVFPAAGQVCADVDGEFEFIDVSTEYFIETTGEYCANSQNLDNLFFACDGEGSVSYNHYFNQSITCSDAEFCYQQEAVCTLRCGVGAEDDCKFEFQTTPSVPLNYIQSTYDGPEDTDWCVATVPTLYEGIVSNACCPVTQFGEIHYRSSPDNIAVFG